MTLARSRILIVVSVLLVFGRLLWCDFTWWDDWMTVHQNSLMQHVSTDTFTYNWTHSTASIYIPLTYTVWGVVSYFAQVPPDDAGINLNATYFHLTNILVHVGGALAAFALLRRLVRNDTAALLGTLLWAVHPVQVESVGWISGLKDVLSGTLVLYSLLLYVLWRQDGKRWSFAAACAVYLLAMLAKPSAFTMPLLVVVIDRLLLHTPWKKVALALVPLAILTLPIAYIARQSQPSPASYAPGWVRALVAGDSLAFYGLKTIFPLHLAFDYGRNIPWLRTQAELYYAWLLPLAVAVGVAWAYRRAKRAGRPLSPLPAAGLLIFTLAPLHVLGLVRFDFQVISVVADHYLYVALIGAAIVLAWAVSRWSRLTAFAAVLVAALGVRAAAQTPVWQNEVSLMSHGIEVNPLSWTGYINLAVQANKAGDTDMEYWLLQQAEKVKPDDPALSIGMMIFAVNHNRMDEADHYARRLLAEYEKYWIPAGGSWGQAYYKILNAYLSAGRLDEAEAFLNEAVARDPKDLGLPKYAERLRWARQHEAEKRAATQSSATKPAN